MFTSHDADDDDEEEDDDDYDDDDCDDDDGDDGVVRHWRVKYSLPSENFPQKALDSWEKSNSNM